MLTDCAAEAHIALERRKKIQWFTAAGSLPASEDELAALKQIREIDRLSALGIRGDDDANRRVPVFLPHSAPLDIHLRNPSKISATGIVSSAHQHQDASTNVFPPHPMTSYVASAAEHLGFVPGPSDFYPNTKTIIDSRRNALQQFRQLCYFTLLRKRVESRLDLLQRERGMHAAKMQSAPTGEGQQLQLQQQQQAKKKKNASQVGEDFGSLLLGGLLDTLHNPVQDACALSREVKQQVERRLSEAAARFEAPQSGRDGGATSLSTSAQQQQQQQHGSAGGKGKRSRSNEKGGNSSATRSSSDSKHHQGGGSKSHDKASAHESSEQQQQQQQQDKAARFSGGFGGSTSLQLMQPARIADLEVHPEISYREPFLFRSQRMPRLPFPKHDFSCSGPKNVPLNFAAGSAEISESLSETATPAATARAGISVSHQQRGAAGGNNNKQQLQRGSSFSGSCGAVVLLGARPSTTKVPQSQVPERFALPAVSVETFEMPVVAQNRFRPPLATSAGVLHVLACRDFPPEFHTDVASAPLLPARPSLVPPRHQPLRLATQQLLFRALPATMTDADSDDELSDDEDHDLVDAGDAPEESTAAADEQLPRPGTATRSKSSSKRNKGDASEDEQQQQPAQQVPAASGAAATLLEQKGAATYLSPPPLTLDDALASLSIIISTRLPPPPPPHQQQPSQKDAVAAASRESRAGEAGNRPSTPTKKSGAGSNTGSAQQQQQQQQQQTQQQQQKAEQNILQLQKRLALVPLDVRAVLCKNAQERLAFTPQPVHSEDACDEQNDAVINSLRESRESFDRRRAALPSYLQHLV